jgi:hypothetical protein
MRRELLIEYNPTPVRSRTFVSAAPSRSRTLGAVAPDGAGLLELTNCNTASNQNAERALAVHVPECPKGFSSPLTRAYQCALKLAQAEHSTMFSLDLEWLGARQGMSTVAIYATNPVTALQHPPPRLF